MLLFLKKKNFPCISRSGRYESEDRLFRAALRNGKKRLSVATRCTIWLLLKRLMRMRGEEPGLYIDSLTRCEISEKDNANVFSPLLTGFGKVCSVAAARQGAPLTSVQSRKNKDLMGLFPAAHKARPPQSVFEALYPQMFNPTPK